MEFFKSLYNKYFCVNLKDYPNIGIDLQINKLLLLVFLGLCIASVIISYNQSKVALILKKLMRAEAFSEKNAKNLPSLGLDGDRYVLRLLASDSGPISKIVSVVGFKKPTYEEYVELEKERKRQKKLPPKERTVSKASVGAVKIDPKSSEIYIADEKREYAEHTFITNNGSAVKTVLSCVLILAFYVLLVFLMPTLLSYINSITESAK